MSRERAAQLRWQISSRREQTKAHARAYLEAHPCVDCGEADPIVLEFDHVRGEKAGHVSAIIHSGSIDALVAEIAKCDVRCANCHRRATVARRKEGVIRPRAIDPQLPIQWGQ